MLIETTTACPHSPSDFHVRSCETCWVALGGKPSEREPASSLERSTVTFQLMDWAIAERLDVSVFLDLSRWLVDEYDRPGGYAKLDFGAEYKRWCSIRAMERVNAGR